MKQVRDSDKYVIIIVARCMNAHSPVLAVLESVPFTLCSRRGWPPRSSLARFLILSSGTSS